MDKLDILVVEDTKKHQDSARWLLRDHNVTMAEDYVGAVRSLKKDDNEYGPGESGLFDISSKVTDFDVVLSDMVFPMGGKSMSDRGPIACADTHSPDHLGYSLALVASRLHIPSFAILTDLNHHDGPFAATFDFMYDKKFRSRPVYTIDSTRFMMFDIGRDLTRAFLLKNGKISTEDSMSSLSPDQVQFPEDLATDYDKKPTEKNSHYPDGYYYSRKDASYHGGSVDKANVKNWSQALDILVNGYH